MQRHVASSARRVGYLALCVAPALLYLAGQIHPFNVGNADMLGVPAVLETVRVEGLFALGDWYWPPAPYFVIDFLLYTPLWLALPDPWLAPALFMIAQLALVAWVGNRLAVAMVDSAASRWVALGGFAVMVVWAEQEVEPVRFILVSYYRAGTFILGVAGLVSLLTMVRAGRPWRGRGRLGLTAVLTAVLVCSDPLAVPSIVVPLILVVLVLAAVPDGNGGWVGHRRDAVALAGTLVAGLVVGMMVNRVVVTDHTSYGPSLWGAAPRGQLALLVRLVDDLPSALLVVVGVSLVLLAGAAMASWLASSIVGPTVVVVLFWALSTAGHVSSIMADSAAPAGRYLQLVFGLPILAAGPSLLVLAGRVVAWSPKLSGWRGEGDRSGGDISRKWRTALRPQLALPRSAMALLVAVPVLMATVPAGAHLGDVELQSQAGEAACLDQVLTTDARLSGFSGYWEARTIQLHSRYPRQLAVLDGVGVPYRINAAASWFDTPWSFAIVGSNGLGFDPPLRWVRKIAPGAEETVCGPYTIFVFDEPIDPTPLGNPGDHIHWNGCELGTVVGELEPTDCVIAVPSGTAQDFGSFGGYTPLSPGRYEVEVRYRGPAPSHVEIADLELVTAAVPGAEPRIIEARPLAGSDGQWVSQAMTLDLSDRSGSIVLEARTLSRGTHSYEVASLDILTIP